MSKSTQFDAIVVGAGPAGSMAALTLAREGRNVALIERGEFPGDKNLFGGMIYSLELARQLPHFIREAPIERPVTRHSTWLLGAGRSLSVDFSSEAFGEAPYNGFTAYRGRFDRWLAGEAVKAGALLVPSTVVDDLIVEGGAVTGVLARREQGALHAPVVICADGILSLLGRKAGLVRDVAPDHYSLGVREILALPSGVIEDRFQIDSQGGCAAMFVGDWPGKLRGGGFIYTNRDTLSVGFVAQLASLEGGKGQGEIGIAAALDAFKAQPAVRRLIHGGERLEYGAHVVPEGGWNMRPKLVRNGMMLAGDAGAMVLAAGVLYEGVHYAMLAGRLAGETALEALQAGDFSVRTLQRYEERLGKSYLDRNLKTFRHVPKLLVESRLYSFYPNALCQVAEDFFRAEEQGHKRIFALLWHHIVRQMGPWKLLGDLWRTVRGFL